MPRCKVAVLGAGSFVFGPSVLRQAYLEHGLDGLDLVLMDPDREGVELMADVGRRLAEHVGVRPHIAACTEYAPALDGADFVIVSAARQATRRWTMDAQAIHRHAPGHLITEFGGVAGTSYSLRQIALIHEIADAMRRHCPRAWLLDCANPLPRVCQAAQESGVHTVGFCSASLGAYQHFWRVLRGEQLSHPFAEAREAWFLTIAGVNHFTWVLDARDRATEADLYPQFRDRVASGDRTRQPRSAALLARTGFLPACGDGHTRDFLPPDDPPPAPPSLQRPPFHGNPEERQQNLDSLRAVADGREGFDRLHDCWEKPMRLVAAMAWGREGPLHAVNLPNEGQIDNLPRGVFVETPAQATTDGPRPWRGSLPDSIMPSCKHTARVTGAIVRAAQERSLTRLREAVDLDPTITDKAASWTALRACLAAHADLLPVYS